MNKAVVILSVIVTIETMAGVLSWSFAERQPSKVEAASPCENSANRGAVAALEGLDNGFRDAKRRGVKATWEFVLDVVDESRKRLLSERD